MTVWCGWAAQGMTVWCGWAAQGMTEWCFNPAVSDHALRWRHPVRCAARRDALQKRDLVGLLMSGQQAEIPVSAERHFAPRRAGDDGVVLRGRAGDDGVVWLGRAGDDGVVWLGRAGDDGVVWLGRAGDDGVVLPRRARDGGLVFQSSCVRPRPPLASSRAPRSTQ